MGSAVFFHLKKLLDSADKSNDTWPLQYMHDTFICSVKVINVGRHRLLLNISPLKLYHTFAIAVSLYAFCCIFPINNIYVAVAQEPPPSAKTFGSDVV